MKPGRGKRRAWIPTALTLSALALEIGVLVWDVPFFGVWDSSDTLTRARRSLPPVAELVVARNDVRVQAPGELIWDKAEAGLTLVRRQSVLTSAESKAEIAFLDGTGIVVDENSLIQVEKTPGDDTLGYERIRIKLLRGTIHKVQAKKRPELLRRLASTTGAPALDIEVGDVVARITPSSEFSIAAVAGGASRVIVTSGDLEIKSGGSVTRVKQGDEAKISKKGNLTFRQSPYNLISPKPGESAPAETPIPFQWSASPTAAAAPSAIELSRDPGFPESATIRHEIPATSRPMKLVAKQLKLPGSGLWHWRVRSLGSSTETSDTRKIFAGAPLKPALSTPRENGAAWAELPVSFSWHAADGAEAYELEVRSVSGSLMKSAQSKETFARMDRLPAGEAKWRVRARFADGASGPWSDERAVRMVPQSSELPPPDELFDPEIVPQMEPKPKHTQRGRSWWELIFPSAHAAPLEDIRPEGFQVHLKWKPVRGAAKYRVQISKQRDFKTTMEEVQTESPEWVWRYEPGMENSKGRVFYRVASVDSGGKVGRYSSAKPIPLRKALQVYDAGGDKPAPDTSSSAKAVEEPASRETGASVRPEVREETIGAEGSANRSTSTWRGTGSFGIGVGNLSQSDSGSSLKEVRLQSAYLQQHAMAEVHSDGEYSDHWTGRLYFNLASFESGMDSDSRQTDQPEVSGFNLKLEILRMNATSESGWQFGYGAVIERSFRWVRTAAQVIEPQGGFSAGPTAWARQRVGATEAGFFLNAPLTGALTGAQVGVNGGAWAQWSPSDEQRWLSLRIEADASFASWSKPESASQLSWIVWVAPTIRFGGSP